jgi:hypothetical protein
MNDQTELLIRLGGYVRRCREGQRSKEAETWLRDHSFNASALNESWLAACLLACGAEAPDRDDDQARSDLEFAAQSYLQSNADRATAEEEEDSPYIPYPQDHPNPYLFFTETIFEALGKYQKVHPILPQDHSVSLALKHVWLKQAVGAASRSWARNPDCLPKLSINVEHNSLQGKCKLPIFLVGQQGHVATLTLQLVRLGPETTEAARYPRAGGVCLVAAPASSGLPVSPSFRQSLGRVEQYLRQQLQKADQGHLTADLAVAWHITLPDSANGHVPLHAISGPSASAAMAAGSLWLLRKHLPDNWCNVLEALSAKDLTSLRITAEFDPEKNCTDALGPVGSGNAKHKAVEPWWASEGPSGHRPLYVHSKQVFTPEPPPDASIKQEDSLLAVLTHFDGLCNPLTDAERTLKRLIIKARAPSGTTEPDFDPHDTPILPPEDQTLPRLLKQVINGFAGGGKVTLQRYALYHWACREDPGQLHSTFVNLKLQPPDQRQYVEGDKNAYPSLVKFLDYHQATYSKDASKGVMLTGGPGAGKTTLIRHHIQRLCEALICASEPEARELPVPLMLPLKSLCTNIDFASSTAHDEVLDWIGKQVHGFNDLLVENQYPDFVICLDGINELPLPKARPDEAPTTRPARVAALIDCLKPEPGGTPLLPSRHPLLLSVRTHHAPDLTGVLRLDVLPWTADDIARYVHKRLASQSERAEALVTSLDSHPMATEMCGIPMLLAMLCDLWEAGRLQTLPQHRAELYAHWLWLTLHRELEQRQSSHNPWPLWLLTQRDQDKISAANKRKDLYDLPTEGALLRNLLDQAERQYWQPTDQHADTQAATRNRCAVAVPWDKFDGGDGKPVPGVRQLLRHAPDEDDEPGKPLQAQNADEWRKAAQDLRLVSTESEHEFSFSHQTWGEWLAAWRLLRRSPAELDEDMATYPPEHPKHQAAQTTFDRVLKQTRWPAALSAREYLDAQTSKVNDAWAKVLTPDGLRHAIFEPLSIRPEALAQDMARERNLSRSEDSGDTPAEFIHKCNPNFRHWASANYSVFDLRQCMKVLANNNIISQQEDGMACLGMLTWQERFVRQQFWQRLEGLVSQPAWYEQLGGYDEAHKLLKQLQQDQGHLALPEPGDLMEVLPQAFLMAHGQDVPHSSTSSTSSASPTLAAHWLARCIQAGQWWQAVPAALALRHLLEPLPPDKAGHLAHEGCWQPCGCHVLLQHLRRRLWLCMLSEGPGLRAALEASGCWAALQQPLRKQLAWPEGSADKPKVWTQWLQWCNEDWEQALAQWASDQALAIDLRTRWQAGLWLGDMGHNLMLERLALPNGRALLGLKAGFWRPIGQLGQPTRFKLGDQAHPYGEAQHEWQHPMPGFLARAFKVTVAEWRSYIELLQTWPAEGLRGPQPALPAVQARDWLKQPGWSNLNLPATGMNWFDAMAFTGFMDEQVYRCQPWWPQAPQMNHSKPGQPWQLALPTEAELEAAARGPHHEGQASPPQQAWSAPDLTHGTQPEDMALRFNHDATRMGKPTPVGLFPAAYTLTGVADASGNVHSWCANFAHIAPTLSEVMAYGPKGQGQACATTRFSVERVQSIGDHARVAVRGGSFIGQSVNALLAYRDRCQASTRDDGVGLSWVVVVRAP